MYKSACKLLKKFTKDQRGTVSVETVLAFPMLVWVAIATYTYFDAYKMQNAVYRANYTIGDVLSRETDEVNQDYLDTMHNLMMFMTRAPLQGSWIRVSLVTCKQFCDLDKRTLALDWSHSTGGARKLSSKDFNFYGQYIPALAKGDRLILVETSIHYEPPFKTLLLSFPERDMVSHSVTRPRFAPQVVWERQTGPA